MYILVVEVLLVSYFEPKKTGICNMGPRRQILSQICFKIGPVGPTVLFFVTKVVLCGAYRVFFYCLN